MIEAAHTDDVSNDTENNAETIEEPETTEPPALPAGETTGESDTEEETREAGDESDFFGDLGNNPMFNGIVDGEILDMRLRHVIETFEECKLRVTDEGIGFCAVDPGNVAMFHVKISPKHFESFEVENPGIVGVSIEDLRDWIKTSSTDNVEVTIDGNENQLRIGGMNGRIHAGGATIDPDSIRSQPDFPNLDLPAKVRIKNILHLTSYLDQLSSGEHVMAVASRNGISFRTDRDISDVVLTLPSDDNVGGNGDVTVITTGDSGSLGDTSSEVESLHGNADVERSFFSADYLIGAFKKLLKRHKDGASYELLMGTEFPMKLKRECEYQEDRLDFMMAPRITADD